MAALVIAEHDHATVKPATLNTVTRALHRGRDGNDGRAEEPSLAFNET